MLNAKNKSGYTVQFNPIRHTFTILETKQKLPGVTTIIKQFYPFDKKEVAAKCAGSKNYKNMTVEQVLEQWNQEGKRGAIEGTNVHEYAEYKFKKNIPKPTPISDRCVGLFEAVNYAYETLTKWYDFIESEKIVFSVELQIAGIIDILLKDKQSNEIILLDWKQNKEIKTTNPYQKALSPINHLDSCHLTQYNCQAAMYRKILIYEKYFDVDDYRLGLVHLLPNGKFINLKLQNYEQEIEDILQYINNQRMCKF